MTFSLSKLKVCK